MLLYNLHESMKQLDYFWSRRKKRTKDS